MTAEDIAYAIAKFLDSGCSISYAETLDYWKDDKARTALEDILGFTFNAEGNVITVKADYANCKTPKFKLTVELIDESENQN